MVLLLVWPLPAVAGSLGKGEPAGTPGEWYLGTTPDYVDPYKSPIVFVHGLNSSASTWWEGNDMYDTAYANGYETAFIDLYPTRNMWDNGQLLAEKIEEIYNHFGEKLVVVSHSKGGIDTQAALVHYGADPYVHRVITLSSPHHGSELADLAYSSWAGWLAGILGSKSDATYSMQTGYMDQFRTQTDSRQNVYRIPFYTFGGTAWGSFGSSLYWGGLYLSSYGPNDGAVTVQSSRLSYATEVSVGDWNHSEIRQGSSTFDLFESLLYENAIASKSASSIEKNTSQTNAFYKGGSYRLKTTETFAVEEGVSEITIDWISTRKEVSLVLKDPDGRMYSYFSVDEEPDFSPFAGAYHHSITIPNPKFGQWTIEASAEKEKYLLGVFYKSHLNQDLDISVSDQREVTIYAEGQTVEEDGIKATISLEYYQDENSAPEQLKLVINEGNSSVELPYLGSGVYNLTTDITGQSSQGKEFNRTVIQSVYIDQTGDIVK
ncbi:triacylglycerol lipase [Bacillus oleivorans]|uniref:Triacylglycerol lipase n=1 Tax=Bacillus oleivorans TaxID=1448271 RepID=A0A285CLP3_9BACI|nr:triacylglycerol lipase [Bacillus oleivorans]